MTTAIKEEKDTTPKSSQIEKIAENILARAKELIEEYESTTNEFSKKITEEEYTKLKEGLKWKDTLINALPHFAKMHEGYVEYGLNYASKKIYELDIMASISWKYLHCTIGATWDKMIWPYTAEELVEIRKSLTNAPQKERICPKCGGKLVERTGRYGKFLGCENYPNCRYTERL